MKKITSATLVRKYLTAKPLNTSLNILLLALGVAVITILLILNRQLQEKISDNTKGIDLVVGAKGSPLQLILCNIFHIDFPTGNIKLNEAERIAKNRLVKKAIPLALGDSYEGFRIIGTTPLFREHYNLELSAGEWWNEELEVSIGSFVASSSKLALGDRFTSSHGLVATGHAHDQSKFVVKGILKPTGTVVDNLILTNVESIWHVHEEGHHEDESDAVERQEGQRPSPLVPSVAIGDSTKEITSMLITYRSPMGAIQLPRLVNSQSMMQAASPAFESARLFSILGAGVEVISAFAGILVFISALSIFIALYNALKERRYDMAIMRSMGASRSRLSGIILAESLILTVLGTVGGLIIAHVTMILLREYVPNMNKAGISGFVFYSDELIILLSSLFVGLLCGVIPAMQAYRTDISKTLAGS